MLRRFVLFLTLACVLALVLPLAAHAATSKVTVELPLNGTVADDVHIVYYYYNSSGNPVAMPVSSAQAKVWNGSSWVSAGTVSISGGTTVTVTSTSGSWPTTGRVAIQATVTKPAWNTSVQYWYQWTYGGIATNTDYAYVDGIQRATADSSDVGDISSGGNLFIGARTTAAFPFDGLIGAITIHRRVVTPGEIKLMARDSFALTR